MSKRQHQQDNRPELFVRRVRAEIHDTLTSSVHSLEDMIDELQSTFDAEFEFMARDQNQTGAHLSYSLSGLSSPYPLTIKTSLSPFHFERLTFFLHY